LQYYAPGLAATLLPLVARIMDPNRDLLSVANKSERLSSVSSDTRRDVSEATQAIEIKS
jgi:hypothetical protein